MSIAAEMKVKTPLNNSHAAQNIITNLFNIHVTVLRGCLDFLRVRRAIYGKQYCYSATLCVSAVFAVDRCPSVRLSVKLVDCTQMAEDVVKLISRHGSPVILVFFDPELRYPIPRGTLSAGTQNTMGGKILRFSTSKMP